MDTLGSLAALVAFSIVSSGTPGPNNVLLWASGATFGFKATIPHVLGTAAGIGAMALGAAAGLAALIAGAPQLALVMKVGGSAYLLVLAWRIARSSSLERAALARPLDLRQAMAFQAVNPKGWIFALGAVTTFRPAGLDPVVGSVLVATTMMAVIVPTAALWAGAGGSLGRMLAGQRTHRVVGPVMGVLLATTVVLAWV
jgi:threonine/homoserine/homoserine lactone efflux protein